MGSTGDDTVTDFPIPDDYSRLLHERNVAHEQLKAQAAAYLRAMQENTELTFLVSLLKKRVAELESLQRGFTEFQSRKDS